MRSVWADRIWLGSLILLVALYFFRLFYPVPSLIVTPDYGRSDAWHFSFATKYVLSESLKSNTLPLWRSDIGDGFPLFGEGQTGAFFLPNILLFRFLPPVAAYNTALAFAVLLLGMGMYLWGRVMKLSPIGSWFTAVSIAFSGLTMSQLTHITLLQGISLLPIITAVSIRIVQRGPYPWMGLLALLLSQQITAGFPQATFLTCIISAAFVVWESVPEKKWSACLYYELGIILGIGGGFVQLLPSWEFLKSSLDPGGFTPAVATMYSMPIKHLISFISPFALGNPKLGTYPPFYAFDGSIFWENTAYIGLLPILLIIPGLIALRKQRYALLLLILGVFSLLLAGGKYAPTYIVFSAWPLTLFRVPSRFLWFTVIAISLSGGLLLSHLEQKNRSKWIYVGMLILVSLHAAQLLSTWWSYHLIEPAKEWMTRPYMADAIGTERMISIGNGAAYNDAITTSGWVNPEPYRLLRQTLTPDSNMIWHITQHNVYAGRYLKRPSIADSLLSDSITTGDQIATISATKYLNLFSVRQILSSVRLDAPGLVSSSVYDKGNLHLTLYTNPNALPRAYLTHEASVAATLTDAIGTLTSTNFIPGQSILLESHDIRKYPELSGFTSGKNSTAAEAAPVIWLKDTHTAITLTATPRQDSLLVLTDTYYPGWDAAVDGVKTPILAANLSQRAVIVPSGPHRITFTYRPMSLFWGAIISGVSYILITILMIALKIAGGARIRNKAPGRVSDHLHTRRM